LISTRRRFFGLNTGPRKHHIRGNSRNELSLDPDRIGSFGGLHELPHDIDYRGTVARLDPAIALLSVT